MASRRIAKLVAKSLRAQTTTPSPFPTLSAEAYRSLISDSSFQPEPDNPLPTTSPFSPAPLLSLVRRVSSTDITAGKLLRLIQRLRHHPRLCHHDLRLLRWASTLDGFRHDHDTYRYFAFRLAASGQTDELRRVIRRAAVTDPCPCCKDSIFACSNLIPMIRDVIALLCSSNRFDDAEFLLKDAKSYSDSKIGAELYNLIMSGYAKVLKHSDALRVFDEMTNRDRVKPDAYSFNIVISSCCRNESFELALDWFKRMRKAGCQPNVVTFNILIKGFFKKKRFEEGIGVAREMIDLGYGLSVATCEILVNGLCRDGRAGEAVDLLICFVRKGVILKEFDCLCLAEAICHGGLADRAIEIVDTLWENGNSVSVVACTTLVEGLRVSGKVTEAYMMMERMIGKEMIPDVITFNCLLEALCSIGRTVDANRLRVLGSKKGLEPDEISFGTLVKGFTKEGRRTEGESVVDEMLDAGFIPNIATYNQLMDDLRIGKKASSACS